MNLLALSLKFKKILFLWKFRFHTHAYRHKILSNNPYEDLMYLAREARDFWKLLSKCLNTNPDLKNHRFPKTQKIWKHLFRAARSHLIMSQGSRLIRAIFISRACTRTQDRAPALGFRMLTQLPPYQGAGKLCFREAHLARDAHTARCKQPRRFSH